MRLMQTPDDPWDCRRHGRHKPVGPSVASHRRRAAASGSRCGQAGQAVAVRRTRAGWQNGIRVVLTHRPWEASTRSGSVNEPQINVDHFYHRPIYHVVGLLGEQSEISAISRDLASAGVDVAAVEILCGEQGARILDEHGRYHGLRARIVRAFQRLGYDETTLEIYDEALRKGDLLLHVPGPASRAPPHSGTASAPPCSRCGLLRTRHVRTVPHPRCELTAS